MACRPSSVISPASPGPAPASQTHPASNTARSSDADNREIAARSALLRGAGSDISQAQQVFSIIPQDLVGKSVSARSGTGSTAGPLPWKPARAGPMTEKTGEIARETGQYRCQNCNT